MSFLLPTFSLTSNNWKSFKDRKLSYIRKNGHYVSISCREEKQIRLVVYVIFPKLGFNNFFLFFLRISQDLVKSLITEGDF